MPEIQQNIAETVAKEARKPFPIDHPYAHIAVPEGWKLEDTEKSEFTPRRKRGNVKLNDADSFIAYSQRHHNPNVTTIFTEADYATGKVSFTSIFNDHGPTDGDAQWRDHTATFTPVYSEEWKRWFGKNKQQFNQAEFAIFVEDNLKDFSTQEDSPTGAQMLEMALNFEANQESRFKSAIRLQNGAVQLQFIETDDAQTMTKMQMFERFTLGLPVFWNGDAYALEARLRYRHREGKLAFWFELIRPDRVLEDATKTLITKIKTETDIPLFMGNPGI